MECDRPALVAVTVTVNVPTEPLHASVEVPVVLTVTLAGLREQSRPFDGDTLVDNPTLPEKPFRLVTVSNEVPTLPA